MKHYLVVGLVAFANVTLAQNQPRPQPQPVTVPCGPVLTVAYEGGNITHPGASIGYSSCLENTGKWAFYIGVKAGFYYHRRYHTGVFLLPHIRAVHQSATGWMWGAELNAGPQRHFISNAYTLNDAGSIKKEKWAGISHWLIAPGLRFGRDISEKTGKPIQWFINPQLQFRNPKVGRNEKYLLMGAGINYKL